MITFLVNVYVKIILLIQEKLYVKNVFTHVYNAKNQMIVHNVFLVIQNIIEILSQKKE